MLYLAAAEFIVKILALGVGGLAGNERQVEAVAQLPELVQILANDEYLLVGVLVEQVSDHIVLGGVFAGNTVFTAPLSDGVFHAQRLRQGDADFRAGGLGDPAARLQLAP